MLFRLLTEAFASSAMASFICDSVGEDALIGTPCSLRLHGVMRLQLYDLALQQQILVGIEL